MASERRVKLSPSGQTVPDQGYRLVIEAVEANLMDPAFFVMRRYVSNSQTGATQDLFDHIATPTELITLPVDEPTSASDNLYRTATLDQTWANEATADAAWQAIQSDVTLLKNALDAADNLSALGDVWIGTPPSS